MRGLSSILCCDYIPSIFGFFCLIVQIIQRWLRSQCSNSTPSHQSAAGVSEIMAVHKYIPCEGFEHSCFKNSESFSVVHLAICMWCIIALIQSDCCQIMALQPMFLTDKTVQNEQGVEHDISFTLWLLVCALGSVCLLWAAESECSSEIRNNPAEGIIYNDCIWILSDTRSVTILLSFFLLFILPQLLCLTLFRWAGWNKCIGSQTDWFLRRGFGDLLAKSADSVHTHTHKNDETVISVKH